MSAEELERLRAELANRDMLLEKYRETVSVIVGQRGEATAERDVLRQALSESDLGSQILAQWEAIDELKTAIAMVRADCRAMAADQPPADTDHQIWLTGVRAQAMRVLNILTALGVPESPGGES